MLLQPHPKLITHTAMWAIALEKNGKPIEAEKQLEALENIRGDYQYGSVDYAMAQYYAAMNDENNTIKYLLKAVAAGRWYDTSSFQNDPFLKKYNTLPAYKNIMKLWH